MTDCPPRLFSEISKYKFDDSVGYLFARVRSTMASAVNQYTMSELGITSTQASIIFLLGTGKCAASVDLAREYGIDASAVTRLIDRLEKHGLLARIRSKEDRRVVKLELTAPGYELAARMPPIFNKVMNEMLKGFEPVEIDTLRQTLKRILCNADERAITQAGKLCEESGDT